jgi:hypothetical protein
MSDVAVTNRAEPFEVEVKRFYVPAVVACDCPNCGERVTHDMENDYLSYPVANEPFDHGMYCAKCEHEWTVLLTLTVRVEVAS